MRRMEIEDISAAALVEESRQARDDSQLFTGGARQPVICNTKKLKPYKKVEHDRPFMSAEKVPHYYHQYDDILL